MKNKTKIIQLCDKCDKELPEDFVDCYIFSECKKEISHHNGDEEICWSDLLQLCETCGNESLNTIKEIKVMK